jgi:ATP-dependent RNA helicase SUPV3L1/SUV3
MMVAQGEEDRGENVGNGEEIKRNHAAIVYGKLPPECRKDQARRFNDKNLPFLVATNAIGMGLNLNIKRIVFMAIHRTLDGHRV